MAGATLIAAVDEAAVSRTDGAAPRLQDGERAVADRIRVGTIVQLRLETAWPDLPVVGTAMVGLAIAAARAGRTDDAARCWAVATRFGSRQDFAVLAHARVRPLLVAVVGEQPLADAETASAGWDRTEAVSRTLALLGELRYAFRM